MDSNLTPSTPHKTYDLPPLARSPNGLDSGTSSINTTKDDSPPPAYQASSYAADPPPPNKLEQKRRLAVLWLKAQFRPAGREYNAYSGF